MKAKYFLLTLLPVLALYLHHQADLRGQEIAAYQAEIARLHQEIDARDTLIAARDAQIGELEELLNIRRQTYIAAVAGEEIPANSASGFVAADFENAYEKMGGNLSSIAPALEQAEQEQGVNGLFLAAVAVHESGNGTSWIARNKRNLFGLGAYDRDPRRLAYTFDAPEESVFATASLLSREYLNRSGRYYHGETPSAINTRYASDPLWAAKVGRAMGQIAKLAIDEPELLLSYAPRGVPRVFGNSIDIATARRLFAEAGIDAHFVTTDNLNPDNLPLKPGDLVVGGAQAAGGVPQAFPAERLAGEDRAGTEGAIKAWLEGMTS